MYMPFQLRQPDNLSHSTIILYMVRFTMFRLSIYHFPKSPINRLLNDWKIEQKVQWIRHDKVLYRVFIHNHMHCKFFHMTCYATNIMIDNWHCKQLKWVVSSLNVFQRTMNSESCYFLVWNEITFNEENICTV